MVSLRNGSGDERRELSSALEKSPSNTPSAVVNRGERWPCQQCAEETEREQKESREGAQGSQETLWGGRHSRRVTQEEYATVLCAEPRGVSDAADARFTLLPCSGGGRKRHQQRRFDSSD